MEKGEGQDIPSVYCDSDSDDSIVVTISQMQDEAAKLQSTAAEIREELSGLLATLDDIEHRSTTVKRKKIPAKALPESGDSIREEVQPSAALKAVVEGKEPTESDDRYRDVTTTWTEPARQGFRGDVAASVDDGFKPCDARELLDSLLDVVMERQSGAGDSLDAHPQHSSTSKEDAQSVQKSCSDGEGQHTVGDVDAATQSSDSDDHDVVVSAGESSWEASDRRRVRRPRKPGSEGSLSSDARSSSTADDVYLDPDAMVLERGAGDIELIEGTDCPYYLLD